MPLLDEVRRRRRGGGMFATPPFLPETPTLPLPPPGNPGSMPGPSYGSRPQSRYEQMNEAESAYLQKTPGRGRSALTGALRGFAQGGLRGAVLGAGYGAIDPRGLREEEFNQKVRPKIEQRFGYEDQDRAQQMAELNQRRQQAMDALKMQETGADINLKNAQAEKARMPEPVKEPTPQWRIGRDLLTGRYAWRNLAVPGQDQDFEPHVSQPTETPIFRVDEHGNFVDVRKAAKEGKTVKAYQRPRVGRAPKESPKYVSHSQILQYAQENNMSSSDASAIFKNKGYRVTN